MVNNLKDLRMYILANEDIEISSGKLSGQVGHSVNVLGYNMCKAKDKLIDEYMQGEIKCWN